HFRIASVTKMVSAIGVLRLVEQGMLELDRDASDYFAFPIRNPYYPNTPVTLRQIMSHTATLKDDYHYERAARGQIEWLHNVFHGNYTNMNYFHREPGTYAAYSNFGGGMLGVFMEQLTGLTIDEYMARNVFAPLSITAAYHTPCLPYDAKIARVYEVDSSSMTLDLEARADEHFDAEPELDYAHTAGALMITAEGLAKIVIALAGDGSVDGVRLLLPETVEMMRTRQDHIGSVQCDAGRGLNLNIITDSLVRGRTLYGHQGKAYGMICAAYFDPADQTGVVLLTNGCDTSTVNSVARIARAMITQAYTYFP
ncbi:MAG: beta-lactamase family protein, partial [Firmicutes bacterium]|nr:beta-lactamase family protein [Bacillota bacterium]